MRTISAIALTLLFSSAAFAQGTKSATIAPSSLLGAGRVDIAQGAYDSGISKLQQAHQFDPQPDILLEIAVAYSQWQGHCQDAITHFDRFFENCQRCASFAAAKERNDRVRAACLVRVRVETTPTGAMISVDGEAIGSSPLEATVIAGQHAFEAELTGYSNPSASQSVVPGQTKAVVKLALTPLPAFIEFRNIAPEATVLISGVPVRPPKMEVQPGRHTIEASQPGFESKTIEVIAKRGETAQVDLTLDPEKTTYRPYMWGSAGIGAFALASTAAFAVMASEAKSDRDRAMMSTFFDDEYIESLDARIKSRTTLAIVTGSLAGAAGIAALVFWLIEPEEEGPEKVAFRAGPDGIAISGAF